jgi:hypothetical protein
MPFVELASESFCLEERCSAGRRRDHLVRPVRLAENLTALE